MATVYVADTFTNSSAMGSPEIGNITQSFSYVTGASFTPTINSTLKLAKIPRGACIIDFLIWIPDIDSVASLQLSLGLLNTNSATAGLKGATAGTSNAAIFLATSTAGRAAALVTATNNPNGIVSGCVPTAPIIADDVLTLLWAAAPAGAGAGGTLAGYVTYFMHTDLG